MVFVINLFWSKHIQIRTNTYITLYWWRSIFNTLYPSLLQPIKKTRLYTHAVDDNIWKYGHNSEKMEGIQVYSTLWTFEDIVESVCLQLYNFFLVHNDILFIYQHYNLYQKMQYERKWLQYQIYSCIFTLGFDFVWKLWIMNI